MATFTISYSDPLRPDFTIAPGSFNGPGGSVSATSLRLYGNGALSWGESVDEDLVRLNENFAGATAPITPIAGQLWFEQELYWYNTSIGSIATLGSLVPGTLYANGTYTGVTLSGGTGLGATATIVVAGGVVTTVTITGVNVGYTIGDVLAALHPAAIGGSGIATTTALVGGSLYTNNTYTNVPLTGGTGSGAQATIVVSGFAVTSVTITSHGTGYVVGDVLSALTSNIGGTGSGFTVTVATLQGTGFSTTVTAVSLPSGLNAPVNALSRYNFTTNQWDANPTALVNPFAVLVTSLTLENYIAGSITPPVVPSYLWSTADVALYRYDSAYAQALPSWMPRSFTTSSTTPTQPTYGSQTAVFSPALIGGNGSGLANNATVYTTTITINGEVIPISITGSAAQTVNRVVTLINAAISQYGDGTAALVGGNIVVTSSTLGSTSSVLMVTGTLFPALPGFSVISAAVQGVGTFPAQSLLVYDQFGQQFTSPTIVDNIPTAPKNPSVGHFWINSSNVTVAGVPSGVLAAWSGSSWEQIGGANIVLTGSPLAPNASPLTGSSQIATIGDLTDLTHGYLPLAGGTMVGNLVLNADPTTNLEAATKHYVDAAITGISALSSIPTIYTTTTSQVGKIGDILISSGIIYINATGGSGTAWKQVYPAVYS